MHLRPARRSARVRLSPDRVLSIVVIAFMVSLFGALVMQDHSPAISLGFGTVAFGCLLGLLVHGARSSTHHDN